jgi:hypothetical protein
MKGTSRMNPMNVQSAIRLHLTREGPCTLESLLTRLSQFSWSEIFTVVEQLSREGSLVLRRPANFGYEVSIQAASAPERSAPMLACDHQPVSDNCPAS